MTTSLPRFNAIVLAGGASRRIGQDKAQLVLEGRTLLETVLDAVVAANRIVVVGPRRPVDVSRTIEWALEDPPGGGPVAGLAAGIAQLEPLASNELVASDHILVLACDLPFVTAAVSVLRQGLTEHPEVDAIVGIDETGRRQPLVAAYSHVALRDTLRVFTVHNASLRQLLDRLTVIEIPLPATSSQDIDTPLNAREFGVRFPANMPTADPDLPKGTP